MPSRRSAGRRAAATATALLALAPLGLAPLTAQAEDEAPLARVRDRGLGPDARQLVARAEARRALGVRLRVLWDPATGCPRAVTFAPPLRVAAAGVEEAGAHVFAALDPLYAGALRAEDGARLERTATRRLGPVTVLEWAQRLDGVPLDGAGLRLAVRRDGDAFRVRGLSGRVFADAPAGLPGPRPAAPAAAPAPADLLLRTLAGGEARLVLSPLPRDAWAFAFVRVEAAAEGSPTGLDRVLRAPDGAELARHPFGAAEGVVTGPVREGGADARRPLADLYVEAAGRVVTTDARGRHPGTAERLPLGLTGPYERVETPVATTRAGGDLRVVDADRGAANVFYQLGRYRRWLRERYPFLPREAVEARHFVVTGAGMSNAYAFAAPPRKDAQAFDYSLTFGHGRAARNGTIGHERTHTLLYGLGFGALGVEASGMHEGFADYFAAVFTGDPDLGYRSIDRDKVWPRDARGGQAHAVGWCFGGALWDATEAVGEDVVPCVLEAIPTLGPYATLLEARDAVLAAARDRSLAPSRVDRIAGCFADHGIGSVGGEPPVIAVAAGADPALGDACVVYAGSPRIRTLTQHLNPGLVAEADLPAELAFTARDPEGRPVELSVSGWSAATVRATPGAPGRAVLTFDVGEWDLGPRTLTITAQDADGQVATRYLKVHALDRAAATDARVEATSVRAAAGERRAVDLTPLLGEERRFRLEGEPAWARSRGASLELAPPAEAAGVFDFTAEAIGDPAVEVRTTVVLGAGPFLEVYAPDALPTSLGAERDRSLRFLVIDRPPLHSRLPAGEPLTLVPGEPLRIVVHAFGDAPSSLAVARGPRFAALEPAREVEPIVRQGRLTRAGGSTAFLVLRPPEGAPARRHELLLTARSGGRVVARRLELLVVPRRDGANRRPRIEVPTQALLEGSRAELPVRAVDPDGDAVELALIHPIPGWRQYHATGRLELDAPAPGAAPLGEGGPAAVAGTVRLEASREFRVVLRAQDARGAATWRYVQVTADPERLAELAAEARIEARALSALEGVAPARGLSDAVDPAR